MALTYNQIFEYFHETYLEYLEDQDISSEEAIERTFGEYETVLNQSESKKAIVYTAYGEHLLNLSSIYFNTKKSLVKTLSEINLELIQQELSNKEYLNLVERINYILYQIEKK